MMKKTIFCLIAIGSGLAITSCSNDEVLDTPQSPQNEITFNGFVNKNGRGVTDITLANMGGFKVWGYQSPTDNSTDVVTRFNGQDVTVSSAGVASYSPIQYWTLNNYYWFNGYATNNSNVVKYTPAGSTVWPGASADPATDLFGGQFTFNNGVAAYDGLTGAVGDVDLIYAWNKTGKVTTPTPVAMNFKHLLSKVAFKFVNGMTASNIRVYDLKVLNVDPVGTLDMTAETPAWERVSTGVTPFDMNYDNTSSSDMNGLNEAGGIAVNNSVTTLFNIFIPGPFNYTVTFKIDQIQNGVTLATYEHTITFTPSDIVTMAMGNAYVFTANINTDNIDPSGALMPIVFQPAVADWVTNTPAIPGYTEP